MPIVTEPPVFTTAWVTPKAATTAAPLLACATMGAWVESLVGLGWEHGDAACAHDVGLSVGLGGAWAWLSGGAVLAWARLGRGGP